MDDERCKGKSNHHGQGVEVGDTVETCPSVLVSVVDDDDTFADSAREVAEVGGVCRTSAAQLTGGFFTTGTDSGTEEFNATESSKLKSLFPSVLAGIQSNHFPQSARFSI